MKTFYKYFTFMSITLLFLACEDEKKDLNNIFTIEIENAKKIYKGSDKVQVSIKGTSNQVPESVSYYFQNPLTKEKTAVTPSISLGNMRLGKHIVYADIVFENSRGTISKTITVGAATAPKVYHYTILETYPHDQTAYTQGLEFVGDVLFESTGQYGQSTIRTSNYKTGEILSETKLEDDYFGEGLTVLKNKAYQLTWQKKKGLIYNAENLELEGEFPYKYSQQGWGLCNDGSQLYKSDGTERIWMLDAKTQAEKAFIEVYTNRSKIDTINELEWVENRIYANIYRKDAIAIVNPKNGAVEGVINLRGLKSKVTQHPKLDVLNGIAYKGEKDILYITGKNWDKLFKIKIEEKQ